MGHAISAYEVWGTPEIEAAARRVLDAGLGQGRSAIEPAAAAWAPDVAADLRRRIIDNVDAGGGTFLDKLRAQLDGAPRATYLLAAELLFLQVVPWIMSSTPNVTGSARFCPGCSHRPSFRLTSTERSACRGCSTAGPGSTRSDRR